MPSVQNLKLIAGGIGLLIAVLSIFWAGCSFQSARDTVKLNKAVESQKTTDTAQCLIAQKGSSDVGKDYEANNSQRNSDYDSFVQRNVSCSNIPNSAIVDNGTTRQSIILPAGTRLINSSGYAKLLNSAETDRNKVIGLQKCIHLGCIY